MPSVRPDVSTSKNVIYTLIAPVFRSSVGVNNFIDAQPNDTMLASALAREAMAVLVETWAGDAGELENGFWWSADGII